MSRTHTQARSTRLAAARALAALTVLLAVATLLPATATAQVVPVPSAAQEAMARQELASLGVDEAELRARLLARGIDVDAMSSEQLLAARPQIQAVVEEMKREQREASVTDATARRDADAAEAGQEVAEELREAVEDGASVEEARAEALSETQAADGPSEVRIYGQQLFRGKTLSVYRASEQARAPGSYVLDAGDQLAVSIFGSSQTDLLLEVDEDGFVRPPATPRIYLRGRTLDEARRLVRNRLSAYYAFGPGQFALTIDAARTVSVAVYGEVAQSGTYTLSALNGPLNVLLAAGGPTDAGSLRAIELIRDGESTIIDVYEFLQNPGASAGQTLRDNDVINVPLAAELVSVQGGVRRALVYELTARERLSDLIGYAGGLRPDAIPSATRVERLSEGTLRVLDVDPADFGRFDPADGDLVVVPVASEPQQEFVSVVGEVVVPGRFGVRPGLTLGALLDRSILKPGARRDVAFLQRVNDDGSTRLQRVSLLPGSPDLAMEVRRGDEVNVLTAARFLDRATFTVRGAVRDSSRTFPFPQDGRLSLDEAITLSGGLGPNAVGEVVVVRTPTDNKRERRYLRVPLSGADTFAVRPLDVITVFERERFADAPTVRIGGAVRAGELSTIWDPTLSIDDLLFLAGGVRFDAAPNRIEVYRLSVDGDATRTLTETLSLAADGSIREDFALRPFDEVYVRSSADFEPLEFVTLTGEVRYPGSYARIEGRNRVSDFVARAGGLTEEGFAAGATLYRKGKGVNFVVLELDAILASPGGPSDMVLRGGDTVAVPKPQQLVTIYTSGTNADRLGADSIARDGTVQVAYQGDYDAAWYVERFAGGFDPDRARKSTTTVTTAAGGVRETRSALGLRRYPKAEAGSVIRVGLRPPKAPQEPRPRTSWGEVTQAVLATVTSAVTVFLLIDRL